MNPSVMTYMFCQIVDCNDCPFNPELIKKKNGAYLDQQHGMTMCACAAREVYKKYPSLIVKRYKEQIEKAPSMIERCIDLDLCESREYYEECLDFMKKSLEGAVE